VADFYPAVSGDDVHGWSTYIYTDLNPLRAGNSSGTSMHTYIRFPAVAVPQGATITSATLTLTCGEYSSSVTANFNIYANNVDDSVAPTTVEQFNTIMTTTTSAVVEWSSVPAVSYPNAFADQDVSALIQEIVSRDGWVSENAIGIMVKNNGSSNNAIRKFYSRDGDTSDYYPKLAITYTASGTTSTGDDTLPVPTILASSDGVVESLPLLSLVNCYVDVPHSDVIESLPILTISGTVVQSTVIAGDCTLPVLTMTALAGYQTESDADVDLPALTASSTSLTGEIHTGDCDVPFFTISATLLNGGISQGVASLPSLTFSGRTINTGTVSESFPVLTINGYAHGPLLHTLDETLPLLQIVATLVHASTAFRCYVLNTENSAITEYDNFPFNSFATFKGKHLAAGSNGITLLEGNKDNSTDINAYLNVGNNDFDLANIKKITDAYLSMKGDGSYYLTVTSDDGTPHSYLLSATTGDRIKNLKTNVGKGKKGRFFELELSNIAGADFELYDMVLNVELLKRNI